MLVLRHKQGLQFCTLMGKLSKALTIPMEELAEFVEGLVRDLVEETFRK